MKKHPFLIGFLVVSLAGVVFYFAIVASFSLLGRSSEIRPGAWLSDSIAVLEVEGIIESSRSITEDLRDFVEDDSIRGILVRIDSPGGAVAPTQEIYSELRRAAQSGKPIVASMGSTAASGGYYVAAGCDYVVANPGTLTGSIGVIMEFLNFEGTFEKLGLKSEVIKSGKYKDAGNYARSLTTEERKMLQATIDDVHAQFVAAVVEGRKLPPERVEAIADGRIFSGQQALELGFVDKLGSFYDAIDVLKEKLEIDGKVRLIYPKKRKVDFFDLVFDEASERLRQSLWGSSQSETGGRLYFR
jgi:protease-4